MNNALSNNAPRASIHTRITESIIKALEQGTRPWLKPWTNGTQPITRPLRHNGVPYRGINILTLWASALEQGFSSPHWMTFRQALELDAHVRKGEKGSPVVYAEHITRHEPDDTGEDIEQAIPLLRAYTVFNAEQIEGLSERYHPKSADPLPLDQRIAHAETFLKASGAWISHGGTSAYYAPGPDRIQLPPFEAFRHAQGYYATALHELTHWTGHVTRCNRNSLQSRFGTEAYAREELIAELGAAFLCADLGLPAEAREDHAAYIAHWLKVLKEDNRAIFQAAAHAQRATDYLQGLQASGAA